MSLHEQHSIPTDTEQEIRSKVEQVLKGTPFSPSSLRKLSGGTANFMYHATLKYPSGEDKYQNGVVIKQGEGYVALHPAFKIATSRCAIEYESLVHLAELPPTETPSCRISTPETYYFNQDSNTQVQEYLSEALSLKDYALKYYAAPTPPSLREECEQLGHGLGSWLRAFHGWSQEPKQAALRETFAGNKGMQGLKNMINYQQLLQVVDRHPEILGDARDVLQGVSDLAAGELADESALYPIHGDFWTGNILLPDTHLAKGTHTPIRIVDWEMVQIGVRPLDLGQAIAELWQLKLYKDIAAAEWLIRAFVDGYGAVSDDFAYRTVIHVGVHLICFGSQTPGWGDAEQQKDVVRIGKEIIVRAWGRDCGYFVGHVLGISDALSRVTRKLNSNSTLLAIISTSTPDSDAFFGHQSALDCYIQYVAYKLNKRLGALHKDTRSSKKLTTRRYLAGLSFGPSSSVLAQLLSDQARHHSENKASSPFEPVIIHIDTELSNTEGESPAKKLLGEYRRVLPNAMFECVPLKDVLSVKSVDWSTLPLDTVTPDDDDDDSNARLQRLFNALPTLTSRTDLLRQLIRHLLLQKAQEHSCSALLLGHSTTALAALTLSEVANGRGFAVPLQVADGMTTVCTYEAVEGAAAQETARLEFPVYYPLREIFRNELIQYIDLVPPLKEVVPVSQVGAKAGNSVVSHKDLSIEEVMSRYFDSVEEGYAGIVANVVRTTTKLDRIPGKSFCGSCGMSLDAEGDSRWAGEIGDDAGDGPGAAAAGRLCYGCKRSIHG
ncbi:cytoplasmic trna 2-thiolation 2 [Fusarium subglutinans]|uniref:Cytoplasmic tRNA 2-thiolation protein 2 n=1 Tax=Gibberella subglutinans TaxID=42677 RepID=A0A8H5NWV6_GIBSU|nr:cytoplasmic trna 2-thiolation 2 [Fusarium subglutinans]KAF5579893.1 cytoplasmic trna 2-thiolation 2 [Fusarium subglutinans]